MPFCSLLEVLITYRDQTILLYINSHNIPQNSRKPLNFTVIPMQRTENEIHLLTSLFIMFAQQNLTVSITISTVL